MASCLEREKDVAERLPKPAQGWLDLGTAMLAMLQQSRSLAMGRVEDAGPLLVDNNAMDLD